MNIQTKVSVIVQVTRVMVIQLALSNEQKIILNHLTYSTSKLWNVANYNIINGSLKPKELKTKLKDTFWYKNLHSQSAQAVLEKTTNCVEKLLQETHQKTTLPT